MKIEIKNRDKKFFPDGKTKGDLIEYYEKISEYMLPYLRDRPLTMHRFPDGIMQEGFYQKQVPEYFPDWIFRAKVNKKENGEQELVVCNKKDTLIYLVSQGCVSFHTWLSSVNNLNKPREMVFDLDPPNDEFQLVKEAAFSLKKLLDEKDLDSWVKLTGSKGLHVVASLKEDDVFDEIREKAKGIAKELVLQKPKKYTIEQRKNKRKGRLFLDYLRNSYAQTAGAPYSVRALDGAPVATPISWDELSKIDSSQRYTVDNIFHHLD